MKHAANKLVAMKILVGPIVLSGHFEVNAEDPNNPGIGGSEFHSIVLATILAKGNDVTLWLKSGSLDVDGLSIQRKLLPEDVFDLQISFSSCANDVTPNPFPLVAISHHPFDSHILRLPERTLVIVNVGEYQLKTNSRSANHVGIPQIWLPVFLRKPHSQSVVRSKPKPFKVGHVSSLHPSKGFHDVLIAWMKYLSSGGRGTLEVLGGQSLYGISESHPYLPVSKSYGEKLLAIMGGEVHESVKFVGRVIGDVGPRIGTWDLAVLNPKGFGESESVSMKDCWRESVPVIAGCRFGQRDYMRLFPELATSSRREIARIIRDLNEGREVLVVHKNRAFEEYRVLYERGVQSGELWRELCKRISREEPLLDAGMITAKPSARDKLNILFEGFQVKLQSHASKAVLFTRGRKYRND